MTRIISFSGLDGCGKTTLINIVRREIESHLLPTSYAWLRFNHYFTRVFHGFCLITGYTRYETYGSIRIGYHDFYRSQIVSWAAIILNLIDTFLATLRYLYLPLFFTRRVILCDRWVFDIVVDMAVDTYKSLNPLPWWGKAFVWLVPGSAVCFIIKRNGKALKDARPEHAFDRNYSRRQWLFRLISKNDRAITIENNGSVENTVREILNHLKLPAG